MGLGSLMRSGMRVVSAVTKSPIGKVAGMVPGLGTVVNAASLATTAYGAYKAGSALLGGSKAPAGLPVPMAPGGFAGGLPALPGSPMPGNTGGTGILPKGPGGRMQLPWNDPRTPDALKAFALDDQYIRLAMRAPRGYVIVRDASGRPYPLLRSIAVKLHLWRPRKKPIISVRDSQAIKRSHHAIKRLHKFVRESHYVAEHVGKHGKIHFKSAKKGKSHAHS